MAAEKNGKKIAVEIKGFGGTSEVRDLEVAVGQFLLYREMIAEQEPERKLYLAITDQTHDGIFDEPIGELALERFNIPLIVFSPTKEVIVRWID